MHKTTNEFYETTEKDVLVSSPKSFIKQPPLSFSGGSISWLKEKRKDKK